MLLVGCVVTRLIINNYLTEPWRSNYYNLLHFQGSLEKIGGTEVEKQ